MENKYIIIPIMRESINWVLVITFALFEKQIRVFAIVFVLRNKVSFILIGRLLCDADTAAEIIINPAVFPIAAKIKRVCFAYLGKACFGIFTWFTKCTVDTFNIPAYFAGDIYGHFACEENNMFKKLQSQN